MGGPRSATVRCSSAAATGAGTAAGPGSSSTSCREHSAPRATSGATSLPPSDVHTHRSPPKRQNRPLRRAAPHPPGLPAAGRPQPLRSKDRTGRRTLRAHRRPVRRRAGSSTRRWLTVCAAAPSVATSPRHGWSPLRSEARRQRRPVRRLASRASPLSSPACSPAPGERAGLDHPAPDCGGLRGPAGADRRHDRLPHLDDTSCVYKPCRRRRQRGHLTEATRPAYARRGLWTKERHGRSQWIIHDGELAVQEQAGALRDAPRPAGDAPPSGRNLRRERCTAHDEQMGPVEGARTPCRSPSPRGRAPVVVSSGPDWGRLPVVRAGGGLRLGPLPWTRTTRPVGSAGGRSPWRPFLLEGSAGVEALPRCPVGRGLQAAGAPESSSAGTIRRRSAPPRPDSLHHRRERRCTANESR